MKYHFVAVALCILGLTYVRCANVSRDVDTLALKLGHTTPTYAIVIDAGSRGTRVNLFTFHHSVHGRLVLDDSYIKGTKPGLSDYAKEPEKVRKSLDWLLDRAKARIPREQWSSTPITLKATAGLRLLPEDESQAILDECRRVFASSGFKVSDDSVAIMDGTDEGIFSWVTVNFLLGKFHHSKNTVAALDLGGASNQVTFAAASDAISENIHHVNVLGKNVSVFTESFLAMGLNAAREKILIHPDNPKRRGFKVWSECVSPAVSKAKWEYAGKTYRVSGPKGRKIRLDRCIDIVRKVVKSEIPHKLPSLRKHKIYAISNYYKTARRAGLIKKRGGKVTVRSLHKLVSRVCRNPDPKEPFLCLDLSYIYVLLHNGYGLGKKTKIHMHRYIDGHRLNWALGAAFQLLQNDM